METAYLWGIAAHGDYKCATRMYNLLNQRQKFWRMTPKILVSSQASKVLNLKASQVPSGFVSILSRISF
ncbi:unnamed protein product [Lathyrus sativus]|nr:unnamed protein product [Lathyrus sativus]